MTRRIQEADLVTAFGGDLVGADMLGDATGLALDHVGLAQRIKDRCLAVVDMAHDGHDRGSGHEVLVLVVGRLDRILDIGFRDTGDLVAEFLDDQLGSVLVDGLVLGRHDAVGHQGLDHVGHALGHAIGKLLDGDRLGHNDIAHDLLALDRAAHHLALLALLAPAHRSQRALPPAIRIVQCLVDGQLARAAPAIVAAPAGRGLLGRRGRGATASATTTATPGIIIASGGGTTCGGG